MHTTFGDILGERLHAEHHPALLARALPQGEVSVVEVRSEQPTFELTDPLPPEDAVIAALQLRDFPVQEYWEEGRPTPRTSLVAGHLNLFDLKRDPRFRHVAPFHSVHFHLPRILLDRVADDTGGARRRDIDYRPGVGIEDPVFKHLALSVMPAFAHPERASRLFVDHVTLTVAVHISTTYGLAKPRHHVARGGLSSWQKRRALELIDAHLDGALGIIELARSCRLSSSHFTHAFKQSTGRTPHQWLTYRRIEKAKGLLRDATLPLVHVGAECGFANQSHFTRVFTIVAGTPPGEWRRRNGSHH